jgi:hypothetical protein
MKTSYSAKRGGHWEDGFYARPHPGPLPRGEGETGDASLKLERFYCSRRLFAAHFEIRSITSDVDFAGNVPTILPLLGGEGRGEGECHTNFSVLAKESR